MTSEAQELKPCPNPYCNYKSGLEVYEELYGPYFKVFCPSCRLCGPRMANAAGAAERWNLLPRPSPSPDSRLVEAADNLAWAAEIEIQSGPRTRSFIPQHRNKVRHWIKEVRAALSAHQTKES